MLSSLLTLLTILCPMQEPVVRTPVGGGSGSDDRGRSTFDGWATQVSVDLTAVGRDWQDLPASAPTVRIRRLGGESTEVVLDAAGRWTVEAQEAFTYRCGHQPRFSTEFTVPSTTVDLAPGERRRVELSLEPAGQVSLHFPEPQALRRAIRAGESTQTDIPHSHHR